MMRKNLPLAFAAALLSASACFGQTAAVLPDAPSFNISPAAPAVSSSLGPVTSEDPQKPSGGTPPAATPATHEDPQQKRIFGIIPNFKSVTAGTKLPPQSPKDKFITASQDSFDYSSLTLAAVVSLESYATSATPEFHTGAIAYGRYFWHSYADEVIENYIVEFILPTALHEDTRYYSLGSGGFSKRATYSLSRAFITRTDGGRRTFNASEIIGAGAAAGVSNFYYPRPERTLSNTLDKWGTSVGIDVLSFFFREFYPDIYHAVFHAKVDPNVPAGK